MQDVIDNLPWAYNEYRTHALVHEVLKGPGADLAVIEKLLDSDQADPDGTPGSRLLSYCIVSDRLDIMQCLLRFGADPDLDHPLDTAHSLNNTPAVIMLHDYDASEWPGSEQKDTTT